MAKSNMKHRLLSGFSLIEIIVTTTVVLLFSGLGMASYNNFTLDRILQAEVNKFVDVVELAKKNASSGYIQTACSSGEEFSGYRVTLAESSYALAQCCGVSCASPTTVKTYTIDSRVDSVTIDSSLGSIVFPPLTGTVDLSGIGNPVTLKSSTGRCIDVTLSSVGLVEYGTVYSTGC
jgi:Tfp pilus assembly protein PilE